LREQLQRVSLMTNDTKQRIIFLGMPGAGKGTQAKKFCLEQEIAHISTGELLRVAVEGGSTLGLRVKQIMESGELVPDELIIEIIKQRVEEPDCEKGYILDGFPRTIPQAEALNNMLFENNEELAAVVYFELSEKEVLKRLSHRREIEGRSDDNKETQLKRINVYRELTEPLVEFYASRTKLLRRVDASGSVDEVYAQLVAALSF